MELARIREHVINNPRGVKIVMANGREFVIPHRDYITFNPEAAGEQRSDRSARSFYVWENDSLILVNAMLVAEVAPMKANGNGHSGRGKGKKSKK